MDKENGITVVKLEVHNGGIGIILINVFRVICGIFGALFVYVHKNIVLFIRRRKQLSSFLQK